MAKVYKIWDDEVDSIKKVLMKESDVIHALIKYHLKNLKADEVMKYREEVLDKID